MTNQVGADLRRVTFFFDPGCPWTWRTSRWLVDAAAVHGVPVQYAALELSAGKPLDEVPGEYRASAAASRLFLRGATAAVQQGRHDLVDRWYTLYGTSRWDDGMEPTAELVQQTLTTAGGADLEHALHDDGLDRALGASRAAALELAGDEAGSPVTMWDFDDRRRGFFGPVLAPTPTGTERDALWDAVVGAARVPEFFELKARRTQSPTTAGG